MRYWLNPKPADPALFAAQVQDVGDCYLNAIKQFEQSGTRTVCVDEMTGLQTLEQIAPMKPTRPGLIARQEFEYERHGTICLTGNFEVATGRVISPAFGKRRGEQDFQVDLYWPGAKYREWRTSRSHGIETPTTCTSVAKVALSN